MSNKMLTKHHGITINSKQKQGIICTEAFYIFYLQNGTIL